LGVLETIRSSLESLADEVVRIVRDKVAEVPTSSERVWRIVTTGGERRPTLERETHKDYDLFLVNRPPHFHDLPTFTTIQQKVDSDQTLRKAFLIPKGRQVTKDDISLRYLLPVMNEILSQMDSGNSQQAATTAALNRLDEYLSSETCKARVIAPLLNFTSDKTNFQILHGVYLRQFSDQDLQDHCGAAHLSPDFSYLHKLSAIQFHLETTFTQQRKVGFDGSSGGEYQKRLDDVLTALRLLQAGAVGFAFMKYEVEDLFGKTMSWTMGYGGQVNLFGPPYHFRESDLDRLRTIIQSLDYVAKHPRFAIAMNRLMGAYVKPFGGDRLIDYWIALESLMIADGMTELMFRVSLRTARLVAAPLDRRQAYDFLRKSYGERSKFVHGSKAAVDGQIVFTTEDYLRKVLLHCVSNRRVPSAPELDSLLLGDDKPQKDPKS